MDNDNLDIIAEPLMMLAEKIHDNAVAKGFWDTYDKIDSTLGYKHSALAMLGRIMLMVSELSEMAEAVRKPGPSEHIPTYSAIEEEAADLLIRLLDSAYHFDWDLMGAVKEKMEFNAGREKMHGGKLA